MFPILICCKHICFGCDIYKQFVIQRCEPKTRSMYLRLYHKVMDLVPEILEEDDDAVQTFCRLFYTVIQSVSVSSFI